MDIRAVQTTACYESWTAHRSQPIELKGSAAGLRNQSGCDSGNG